MRYIPVTAFYPLLIMWFGIDDDTNLLSNTLKNEVIPYCIQEGLIY